MSPADTLSQRPQSSYTPIVGSYGPPVPNADRAPATNDENTIATEARAGIRILVVDDDRTLREGCSGVLQVDGYNVTSMGRGDEALDIVKRRRFDIVLCDLYMTPVSGIDILRATMEANPATTVIVMTGNPSVTSSVEALRLGAWDYLPKPFSATHLQVLVGRAAHTVQLTRESQRQRDQIPIGATAPNINAGAPAPSQGTSLLGVSASFRQAVELARRVAVTDASVMIYGESGTGKEVIANLIHANSRRASRTMVPINCAALPEPLLESEMFGHRKGAFTGADRDKAGLLEVANGGTLFLDELTEMSHPIQAKLLRVIQDGVVRRVGSEQRDAVVDVRFISATNRDPQDAVTEGRLREDLFYRLRVVPIKLPPLRNRPEDIPLLAEHFLGYYWKRHRGRGEQQPRLTSEAMDSLLARSWRGNVRELQNVIEHVAVLAEPNQPIRAADIPANEEAAERATGGEFSQAVLDDAYHPAKDSLLAHFEREYLARLVNRAGGNMSKAARLASIDRTTLYRLMDKHSYRREESSAAPE